MNFIRYCKSFTKRYSAQAWSEYDVIDGQLSNIAYNAAFIKELRESLKEELAIGSFRTDDEVVALWAARRNYESEKPNLEIIHSGIDEDGKLQLKLSWNDAFIKMLKHNGFDGEDEDTIIQAYLASIARENADGTPAQQFDAMSNDEPRPSPIAGATNIAAALDDLPPDTLREIERELRSRAQKRRAKK